MSAVGCTLTPSAGMPCRRRDGRSTRWAITPRAYGHGALNWFYEVISLRTLSAALTFFGLTGKMMLAYGHRAVAVVRRGPTLAASRRCMASIGCFARCFACSTRATKTFAMQSASRASVYVPIPGKRPGAGKVTFRLQNRLVEYQAVTEDEPAPHHGRKRSRCWQLSTRDTVRVAPAKAAVQA